MSVDFYKNLQGFHHFSELSRPVHYSAVPAEWHVVMTDVRNSTQAIAQGRYKDVNLVGASVIMAVLNISGDIEIPYAFGGDGATLLIPPTLLNKTLQVLAVLQEKVRAAFSLELRSGCIPLRALYDEGASLGIGKFQLSPAVAEAVFQGTALALAERWLKKDEGTVLRHGPGGAGGLDLRGLECRWQPIKARYGRVLSLLVRVQPALAQQAWDIYAHVLRDIEEIYPERARPSPVRAMGMRLSFSPRALGHEAGLRAGGSFAARLAYVAKILLMNVIGLFSIKTGKSLGGFDGRRYLSELVSNSDTRKFDEMIRMVLDSTDEQRQALENMLEQRRQRGEIFYGVHASSCALMTCLVFSRSGNHVHFVDGDEGGYALAAVQMKQQSLGAGA